MFDRCHSCHGYFNVQRYTSKLEPHPTEKAVQLPSYYLWLSSKKINETPVDHLVVMEQSKLLLENFGCWGGLSLRGDICRGDYTGRSYAWSAKKGTNTREGYLPSRGGQAMGLCDMVLLFLVFV